jgi:hypothetical protein
VSVNMGQAPVPSSAATIICPIPPGAASVILYSTSATVYLGMSTAVTASNGFNAPSYPAPFRAFGSSKGGTVYGWNSGAGTVTVNFIVSTEA